MTYFSTFLRKHHNHQQNTIFLVVAVLVALFGSTVVNYTLAAANPVFAQQQEDSTITDRAILWVDVKDFISSGTAEDISTAIQSTSPAEGSSSPSSFSAVINRRYSTIASTSDRICLSTGKERMVRWHHYTACNRLCRNGSSYHNRFCSTCTRNRASK